MDTNCIKLMADTKPETQEAQRYQMRQTVKNLYVGISYSDFRKPKTRR